MRKVLRIQNYLNRKLNPIPIAFSDPYKLSNSSKVIIPFKDKLFFQTPIMRLENLLELSNGVFCAEFVLNNTLKHQMLRRFLMNLDMIIIQKLYQQSTELFKSSDGRAIQFSKDIIKDKYYPGMRYEDTNDSFYLQLLISESMFSKLEEQSEYYLYIQIENIQFHKKLFLSNLKLESFQEVQIESASEDEDDDDSEDEDNVIVDDTAVTGDNITSDNVEPQQLPSSDAVAVDELKDTVQKTDVNQSVNALEMEVELDTESIGDAVVPKIQGHVDDQQDHSLINTNTNNPEIQDTKQLSGVSSTSALEDISDKPQADTTDNMLSDEIPTPDELSKFIEMKQSLQRKLEELDTMTRDIQQIYHKLKNKQ